MDVVRPWGKGGRPVKGERLVVFGASGLVGSALCERLHFTGEWRFVPVIHTGGSAARLARLPLAEPLTPADLLDPDSFKALLDDDAVVVNCARGGDAAMRRGFLHLLRASRERRVRRFIHISSTAIFGDDPPPESADPACDSSRWLTDYGRLKLWQDKMVLRLDRQGIPSWIICPGNIAGPCSLWSLGLAARLLSGPLAMVDEGRNPTNVVHVDNLVEALLAAASAASGRGQRFFVNELSPVPWRKFF